MTINPLALLRLTVVLSILLIVAGIGGMVVCLLYMFSADARDIAGAGLGFISGAIFIGSGIISMAVALSALHSNDNRSD